MTIFGGLFNTIQNEFLAGEQEFIMCQHPGVSTVSHFWEMIWQTGAKLCVCLSVIPQQFWPVIQSPLVIAGIARNKVFTSSNRYWP